MTTNFKERLTGEIGSCWRYIKWRFRGSPMKIVTGGWCGCCGKWVENTRFSFRDYVVVDNLYDRNTICSKCIEQSR